MDSWQLIITVICFHVAYGWPRDEPYDVNYKMRHLLPGVGLGGHIYSVESRYVPSGSFPVVFRNENIRRKRRIKRYAEETAYQDADAFLKLLELAKAVSSSSGAPVPSAAKFRALDSDTYPENSGYRKNPNPRRGVNWRRMPEDDYAEDSKADWRKVNYDDSWNMRSRANPEPEPLAKDDFYWQRRKGNQ